ncbi:hypothetical protein TRP8649_02670 [Pelagimonas phthalicica]|uniref:Lipoprotein n=1 Tax=Pelagimonas phthalicica TaxID=1037362 RepID=A0A238JDP4_9RHOB|nr:hypothetical protein [Pelagimonas phthalicica]TDS91496.1 hypothetical protein CLV87_2671 [Pelagimonas phthalicica]SMX28545.1 hypothetical protein TRP8649_02670 [Pelagimonas phthalicica]
MGRIAVLLMVAVAVTGCSKLGFARASDPVFDGERFRGGVKAARSDRQHFVATVRNVSKSKAGAIEAAEHEGIRHCIEYFGTSDIDWEVGPETNPDALVVENDTLTFMGSCRDEG